MDPLPCPGVIINIRMVFGYFHYNPQADQLFYHRLSCFFEIRVSKNILWRSQKHRGSIRFLPFPAVSRMPWLAAGLFPGSLPAVWNPFTPGSPGRRKGGVFIIPVYFFFRLIQLSFCMNCPFLHFFRLFQGTGQFLCVLFFQVFKYFEPLVADGRDFTMGGCQFFLQLPIFCC